MTNTKEGHETDISKDAAAVNVSYGTSYQGLNSSLGKKNQLLLIKKTMMTKRANKPQIIDQHQKTAETILSR